MTFIIYEGPSLLDGKPIVVLAQTKSRNRKIGHMLQTFILRSDIDPITANRTGEDYSICGGCPLRGTPHEGNYGQALDRTCYVTLAHAPLSKFKTYKAGRYPAAKDLVALGRNKAIRIGAYGDGAAVPRKIWDDLCKEAVGWTAYTHQGNNNPERFMTSVESLVDAEEAWTRGERTFRVLSDHDQITPNEVLCPSPRTTCAECRLCAGTSAKAKSIAIVAHGAPGQKLRRLIDENRFDNSRRRGAGGVSRRGEKPEDPSRDRTLPTLQV